MDKHKQFVEDLYKDGKQPCEMFGLTLEALSTLEEKVPELTQPRRMELPVELVNNLSELLCEISNSGEYTDKTFKCASMRMILDSWLEKEKNNG